MTHRTALAVLLVALPAVLSAQTYDPTGLLREARERAGRDGTSVSYHQAGSIRYDIDCVKFSFKPEDPSQSEAVWLNSREWFWECYPAPGDPRHGGGGRQCWERPGYTYRERVQVTLRERKPLLPWESDSFRVCLQGPWVDVQPLATAYKYRVVGGGDRDGSFVLAPADKLAMKPDPAGITAGELSPGLTLRMTDRWWSYYAGEKTVFKLVLKKSVTGPDPTVLEAEIAFLPDDAYQLDFPDLAARISKKLEPGKKYYVKWSFQRLGRVSKPDWVQGAETAPVPYQPAPTVARAD